MLTNLFLASYLFVASTAGITAVDASAPTADEIMAAVDAVDEGDRQVSDIRMVLIDKNGKERVRDLRAFRKFIDEDEYSVSFFMTPADIKNTAFLTIEHGDGVSEDDQWLYLPALGRSKRIPAAEKSSAFMGSDFNYSDMSDSDLKDYHYSLRGQTEVNGVPVWIIESVPVSDDIVEQTGYKKTVSFVRKDNNIVIRAVRWADKGNKVKYFEVKELKKIDDVWTPTLIEMTTKQSQVVLHKTVFEFSNIQYNQSLEDQLFSVRRIEKGI